jgi:hypothetical protein
MPRKKMQRLSPKETDDVLSRLLANTQLAWQEREIAIMRVCQMLDFDPKDERQRHVVFGYLAYFAPPYLFPSEKRRRGRRPGLRISSADQKVLAYAIELLPKATGKTEQDRWKDLSKILDEAISYAERQEILRSYVDRTTHKKRIMRAIRRWYELRDKNRST